MIKFKSLILWQFLGIVIRAEKFGNILDDHHLQNTMREKPESVDIALTTSVSTTESIRSEGQKHTLGFHCQNLIESDSN
jgi:hypothetical protein